MACTHTAAPHTPALAWPAQTAAHALTFCFRIWAGAIYFQRRFYEEADELGLLIYHDLMFIEQGHG